MWYGLGAAKRKGSRAGWRTNQGMSGGRMDKVNLSQKFSLFTSHWEPKIVGQVNGHHVKLAKFQGPFVWHRHENEDELFLVHGGPRCLVRARVHGEHRRRAERANRHGV